MVKNKIDTKHKQYLAYQSKWNRCWVAIQGEDEVKAAGSEYLYKLEGQSDDSYKSYKDRASFYAASGRTLDGLVGLAHRKEPDSINWPASKMAYLEGVTNKKAPLVDFVREVTNNVLGMGRFGVMLDIRPNAMANEMPFMAGYATTSIINWRLASDLQTGKEVAVMVVLREESEEPDPENIYSTKTVTKYRELFIDEEGYYGVRVWENLAGSKDYMAGEVIYPFNSKQQKLTYIPFVPFNPKAPTWELVNPPILDIVNINMSHYRNSADLEHGRHFTALPTPWAAGFKVDGGSSLYIGSPYAWVSEDPGASAGFLEYTGQGLGALENALREKEGQMAILGARMLEEPKRAVEATDTHRIRHAGEQSVLATVVQSIESGFNILLGWVLDWTGQKPPTSDKLIELNTDFDIREISPEMLNTLFQLLQGSSISYDTFHYNLKKGELYPDNRTVEEELTLIDEEPIRIPSLEGAGNVDDDDDGMIDDDGMTDD